MAGCATGRPPLDRALQAEYGTVSRDQGVAQSYAVCCPDVLEMHVAGLPQLDGRRTIGPDGRISLDTLGGLRVEGHGVEAIARDVAEQAGVAPAAVQVRVAEFKSQQIYLFGQVFGLQRAVAYQGPETVLDLLKRVGGVTPGAKVEDIAVVRTRIAEGRSPEVFRVDLQAIVSGKDQKTNIRLQPFDEVYVGESRSSVLASCVPPCLKPIYELFTGLHRSTSQPSRTPQPANN